MGRKTYALTGVTGLFGRNVFFEIIKDNLPHLDQISFIILGRSSLNQPLKNRVEDIFYSEGLNYLSVSTTENYDFKAFLATNITYVDINLSNFEIISDSERQKLIGRPIDYFFHVAAVTDFRNDPKVIETLNQQNVNGTAKVLELCKSLSINEFCHVSSAYACGKTFGDIAPDYTNLNASFRNHYEKTKLQGELLVKEYQQQTGVRCRIFRPSIIVGKLMEGIKGEICKFDTIYGWAYFFLKWKLKNVSNSIHAVYNKLTPVNLRIVIDAQTGLNLVPVDYAAKMMYQVCKQNLAGDYFHLVNKEETKSTLVLKKIFELFNITGYDLVKSIPEKMNEFESFYYKTIGAIFTPYVTQREMKFNTDNLKAIADAHNLHCPSVDSLALETLLNYAKVKNFGLKGS